MKIDILGVKIDNVTKDQAMERIAGFLNGDRARSVVTPNPEFVIAARKDEKFKDILNRADLAIPDGAGLLFAGSFLGTKFQGRVAGSDLTFSLLEKARAEGIPIFLVIRRGGLSSLEEVRSALNLKYPDLNIDGVEVELGDSSFIDRIKPRSLVFVGLGMVKQEKLIDDIIEKVPAGVVCLGIGGTFDFITGAKRRAPRAFRVLRLEWLWRLIIQPNRIGRIFTAVVVFPWLVFVKAISKKQ